VITNVLPHLFMNDSVVSCVPDEYLLICFCCVRFCFLRTKPRDSQTGWEEGKNVPEMTYFVSSEM